MEQLRILLLEDDVRMSALIQRLLEESGFAVTTAYNGLAGKELVMSVEIDLIIADVMLPGMNGLEFCKYVKKSKPNLPVIMLTALGTTDDKLEGFDSGADDYMVKPFEGRELLARIRALLKRYQHDYGNDGPLLKYSDVELNILTKKVLRAGQVIPLTPKEYNLLLYFMNNPEKVISRQEIAENVWSTHFDTGTNYIDVYINYLRKKLDRPFERKLIHTRSGMGFILSDKE